MKLLQQLALVCRRKGMARTTVDAYGGWVNAYLRFIQRRDGQWRHPTELGTADVEAYSNLPGGRTTPVGLVAESVSQRPGVSLQARVGGCYPAEPPGKVCSAAGPRKWDRYISSTNVPVPLSSSRATLRGEGSPFTPQVSPAPDAGTRSCVAGISSCDQIAP